MKLTEAIEILLSAMRDELPSEEVKIEQSMDNIVNPTFTFTDVENERLWVKIIASPEMLLTVAEEVERTQKMFEDHK